MKEVILRITSVSDDIEMLVSDSDDEKFTAISLNALIDVLNTNINKNKGIKREKMTVIKTEYIAMSSNCIVIKQPEHKRIVTYLGKSYEINFPNSIYIIEHNGIKINDIYAYCYKDFDGLNTKLFRYAMPNMLSGNKICIGTAPRKIDDSDFLLSLENIIYTQYSHDFVNDVKSFKETKPYFEYLEKNNYPYDLLISLNQKLKDVL